MSKATEQTALYGLGFLVVGFWLLSNPRCNRGCKTVAEHLLEHGIQDFLAGLPL